MPNYDAIAKRWGLNPRIFRALIRQESGGRQNARSPAGAIGYTQLMPATAKGLGVDPYDPEQNLEGGAHYLRQQLDRFGGDYRKALAAYNAGPGAVQKYGGIPPYRETQNYVRTILGAGDVPLAPSKGSRGASAGSRTTTRIVTPGVDNSAVRAGLIQQFLGRQNQDPLDFALGIRGAQDVAPVTKTSTVRTPSQSSDSLAQVATHGLPTAKRGKVIGTPYSGTHTLGDWQSDNAVDIAVPVGTPMVALQDGTIVKVRRHPQGASRFAGDQITIQGANGNEYFYAHGVARVKPGQRIRKGQVLGTTGSANGVAHLHFGQRQGDPRQHT